MHSQETAGTEDADQRIGVVVAVSDAHRDEIGEDVDVVVQSESQGAAEADIGRVNAFPIPKQHFRSPLDVRVQDVIVPGGESQVSAQQATGNHVAFMSDQIKAETAAKGPLVIELISTEELGVRLETARISQCDGAADVGRLGADFKAGQRQYQYENNLLHNSLNF